MFQGTLENWITKQQQKTELLGNNALEASDTNAYEDEIKKLCNPRDPKDIYNWGGYRIGEGAMGEVYYGKQKKPIRKVAIKICEHRFIKSVYTEMQVLKMVDHWNLVKFHEAFFVCDDSSVVMVMELMEGGPLSKVIAKVKIPLEQVAIILRETLRAIEYLHEEGIIHRDVKSSSVLTGLDGSIKLSDYGLGAILMDRVGGTPVYAPPEMQFENDDKTVDIWSLGIMAVEMIRGAPPQRIDPLETYPGESHDFLYRCLQVEASDRNSASKLIDECLFLKYLQPTETLIQFIRYSP